MHLDGKQLFKPCTTKEDKAMNVTERENLVAIHCCFLFLQKLVSRHGETAIYT